MKIISPTSIQALTQSAPSVMHPGMLQTGTSQFGCNDSFQPALILCPPAIQGEELFKLAPSNFMKDTKSLLGLQWPFSDLMLVYLCF